MNMQRCDPPRPSLLHAVSSFMPGGLEMRTVRLIERSSDQFQHTVMSLDGRVGAIEHLSSPDLVQLLPTAKGQRFPASVLRLRQEIGAFSPDLVLTYNWGTFDVVLACRSLGLALIHHEDGFNADEARGLKTRRNIARRLVLPGIARIVVPSRRLFEIATATWKLPETHVQLIPNGVDVDLFKPGERDPKIRNSLSIPEHALVVGSVGHLREVKNFALLIDVLSRLDPAPEIHLLMVGGGPLLANLQSQAELAGISHRVHFAGLQTRVADYLRAMDIYAITSISEQMPISLLEAMACGLPVVTTAVGDIAMMLPPEQRDLLVEPSTEVAREFSERLLRLVKDGERRARLGRINRTEVERSYSFDTTKDSYLELYRSAMRL